MSRKGALRLNNFEMGTTDSKSIDSVYIFRVSFYIDLSYFVKNSLRCKIILVESIVLWELLQPVVTSEMGGLMAGVCYTNNHHRW